MPASSSLTLDWLIRRHGMSTQRLPLTAERLMLFAVAAEMDETSKNNPTKGHRTNDTAIHVSQRAIALNRTKAHFKSNNRTAV